MQTRHTARLKAIAATVAFAVMALFSSAATLAAQNTIVTPSNPQGWAANSMSGAATVGITNAFPFNGNGSVEFTSTGPADRARWQLDLSQNLQSLANLDSIGMSMFQLSSNTGNHAIVPAMKILIYDPLNAHGVFFTEMTWEWYLNNPTGTFAVDSWTGVDLINQNWWISQLGGNHTNADCSTGSNSDPNSPLALATISHWSNTCYSPGAKFYALAAGTGSGWTGTNIFGVDNVYYQERGSSLYSANFEVAGSTTTTPEPATFGLTATGILSMIGVGGNHRRRRRKALNPA
jgi:hypothetical protein